MPKLKRKFLSEHGVNFFSARWLMIPADQVTAEGEMGKEEAEVSKRCHIYLICSRPSLTYVKDDFQYIGGRITGNVMFKVEGKETKIPFDQEFELVGDAVGLKLSPYPHREIQTSDQSGGIVRRLPANALSVVSGAHVAVEALRNLKVLYIGQAFAGGNRTAIDRLRSHSTLQKILAEASYRAPDDEIFVLTFEYAPYKVISSFDGTAKDTIDDERDSARYLSILEKPLKLGQQIGLIEAGLIRYFQPEYNKIYKAKFPSRADKVLSECYELDFSALIVEIDTEDLGFTLYSEVVPPNDHHVARYNLVGHQKRAGFFHMFARDSEYVELPGVVGTR